MLRCSKCGKPVAYTWACRPFPGVDDHEAPRSSTQACYYHILVLTTHGRHVLAKYVHHNIRAPPFHLNLGLEDGEEKPGTTTLQSEPPSPRVQCGKVCAGPPRNDDKQSSVGQRVRKTVDEGPSRLIPRISPEQIPDISCNPLMWWPRGPIDLPCAAPIPPEVGDRLRKIKVNLSKGRGH